MGRASKGLEGVLASRSEGRRGGQPLLAGELREGSMIIVSNGSAVEGLGMLFTHIGW